MVLGAFTVRVFRVTFDVMVLGNSNYNAHFYHLWQLSIKSIKRKFLFWNISLLNVMFADVLEEASSTFDVATPSF